MFLKKDGTQHIHNEFPLFKFLSFIVHYLCHFYHQWSSVQIIFDPSLFLTPRSHSINSKSWKLSSLAFSPHAHLSRHSLAFVWFPGYQYLSSEYKHTTLVANHCSLSATSPSLNPFTTGWMFYFDYKATVNFQGGFFFWCQPLLMYFLNVLQYSFCFIWLLHIWGMWALGPGLGIKICNPMLESEILTNGP